MAAAPDTIQIRPDPSELAPMREFVRERARACGLSDSETFSACLVATEAVTNAIRHGTRPGGEDLIEVRAGDVDDGFHIEVGDSGRFVPRVQAAPDDVGGRGLGLMRRLTRHFDMQMGSDGTRLSMLLGAPLDELAA